MWQVVICETVVFCVRWLQTPAVYDLLSLTVSLSDIYYPHVPASSTWEIRINLWGGV